jgi:hypothetical protein
MIIVSFKRDKYRTMKKMLVFRFAELPKQNNQRRNYDEVLVAVGRNSVSSQPFIT